MAKKGSKTKEKSPHYVNNKEFSAAMVKYVEECKLNQGDLLPVTDYIASCIYKICAGLSYAPNFIRYSYREDMVMDAVENCIRVAGNFDVTKQTRTGLPNAFSYFTQIAFYAFLRRIAKEKKQWDIKLKMIESASMNIFADFGLDENMTAESMLEKMRHKNDVFFKDESFVDDSEFKPTKKKVKRGWGKKKEDKGTTDLYNI